MDANLADHDDEESKPICIYCLEVVEEHAVFCPHCRAPLSFISAAVPYYNIFAERFILQAAVQKPRSLLSVVGIWVLFGNYLLSGLFLSFFTFVEFRSAISMENLFSLAPLLFYGLVGSIGIFLSTSNYLAWRKESSQSLRSID